VAGRAYGQSYRTVGQYEVCELQ